MSEIKTIIFDLDGTLLDTLDDLTDASNETLVHFGYVPKTKEYIRQCVGNGIRLLVQRILPNGLRPEKYEEIFQYFKEYYTNHCMIKTKEYNGISEMLKKLRDAGFNLAIVSNKNDEAVKELAKHYFGDHISIACGGKDGVRTKPAPDTVIAVLNETSTKPDECIYVGDSDVDIQTAKNAGTEIISVDWGFRTKEFLIENGAKTIVESPEELCNYILSLK